MAEAKILPEGIRFFDKNEKAPDFVLGLMVITIDQLVQYAKDHPEYLTEYQGKKQIKLSLLKSQKGGIYCTVDTWKPKEKMKAGFDDETLPF